jgi:toxin ParE1/3/4
MHNRIRASVMRLAELPLSGRLAETRELVVSGTIHIVPYRVHEGRVEILAIFHAVRNWEEGL